MHKELSPAPPLQVMRQPQHPLGDPPVPHRNDAKFQVFALAPLASTPVQLAAVLVGNLEAAARSGGGDCRSAAAAASRAPTCAACGSSSAGDAHFKQCAQCKAVRYCGKLCQRTHWPVHKLICVQLAK
jgi:hypothetical protein